ncbi:hypothetical protein BDW74DRAFT_67757 [Aspergillus multicolor]|uniref:uncharacterized protein n=1 Tax=Aspergillus multicolor TaxID=41759 RepID=UPI003CCE50A9
MVPCRASKSPSHTSGLSLAPMHIARSHELRDVLRECVTQRRDPSKSSRIQKGQREYFVNHRLEFGWYDGVVESSGVQYHRSRVARGSGLTEHSANLGSDGRAVVRTLPPSPLHRPFNSLLPRLTTALRTTTDNHRMRTAPCIPIDSQGDNSAPARIAIHVLTR